MNTGEVYSIFRKIWVKHPVADEVFRVCSHLRNCKRFCEPGDEQIAGCLLADSQSGKSRTVRTYISKVVVDDCYERKIFGRDVPREDVLQRQRLVLHVTLSGGATVSSLLTDILKAFGDPAPSRGDVPERRNRVYTYLAFFGTELIIIDEVQHLSTPAPVGPRTRKAEATHVQDNLKGFLLAGYPILFVGRPEARHKILSDEQVDLRVEEEIEFGPMSMTDPGKAKIYTDFVGRLGLHIMKHGIFENVDLLDGLIVPKLCTASHGRFGVTTMIVRHACNIAIAAGAPTITEKHLQAATDKLVRKKKFGTYNPFNPERSKRREAYPTPTPTGI